jgi:hypothetical protein
MTAPARSSASPTLWIGLLLVGAAVVAIAFAGQDDAAIGGFADPNGTGPEGLLAFNLFVQESGGSTELDVNNPGPDIDVALLATPAYIDVFSAVTGEEDRTEQNYAPLLAWVEAGGLLITSVDVPGGPVGGTSFVDDDELLVPRGLCTLDSLAALSEVRPLSHLPGETQPSDDSCFGTQGEAVIVSRQRGNGRIIRVASMGLFFNRALDDADNAAVAARLIRIDQEPRVGFLVGPPADVIGFGGGPVDDDGNPVGAGDESLLDLVPSKVIALLVGLGGAFLLYALSRGRRLGTPVLEPVPIELPSSTYTEAVGRLYARTENSAQRSAAILRADLRTDLARRVGMSSEASAPDLAGALGSAADNGALIQLLDGPAPANDSEFVDLAAALSTTRDRVDRGGVTTLLVSDGISLQSNERKVTERTNDD